MDLRISSFEITLRDQRRPAVSGARNVNDAGVFLLDQAIQMHIDEVLARRSAPMPEESRLDMLGFERLFQERIILQINLPNCEVIGGLPVALHVPKSLRTERTAGGLG